MPPHLQREMRRLLREMWMQVRGMRISRGDDTSPEGDLLASPNFGICDTTPSQSA
jgi:hypothetical protein